MLHAGVYKKLEIESPIFDFLSRFCDSRARNLVFVRIKIEKMLLMGKGRNR